MDCFISIDSAVDQFSYSALRLAPIDERRGGHVLLHEIIGVDNHMARDAQRWAALGFWRQG